VVHLAQFARRVTLVVRGDDLGAGMSDYLVQQIRHARNVDVRLRSEVVDGEGGYLLERIAIRGPAGAWRPSRPGCSSSSSARRLTPTGWPGPSGATRGLRRDRDRPRPGRLAALAPAAADGDEPARVFAAGDVRLGSVQRVAAAVGDGSVVVQNVHAHLEWEAERAAGIAPAAGRPRRRRRGRREGSARARGAAAGSRSGRAARGGDHVECPHLEGSAG